MPLYNPNIPTTPGGSDTQVQFNDSGFFGGDAGIVYNKTTDILTATNYAGSQFTEDVKLTTLGRGLYIKEGSNATMGTVNLSSGTAVVSTTKVTANSRIFVTVNGGTLTNVGSTYISARTAGASFTIASTNILDASTVAWLIIEPL